MDVAAITLERGERARRQRQREQEGGTFRVENGIRISLTESPLQLDDTGKIRDSRWPSPNARALVSIR